MDKDTTEEALKKHKGSWWLCYVMVRHVAREASESGAKELQVEMPINTSEHLSIRVKR